VGYMHLRGWWPKAGAPRWPDRVVAPLLAEACESFNQKYVAWLTLSHRWPERTSFVRHEDLLASEARVLLRLQQRHGLQRHAASPAPLRGIILPTHWDHEPPQEHFERFDAEFYRRRDYLTLLTPRLHQVVSEKIDWSLMQRFGYQRVTNSR